MAEVDFKQIVVAMPTFLQDVFRSTEEITLLHRPQGDSSSVDTFEGSKLLQALPKEEEESDGNLTGNPLEDNLQVCDDIEVSTITQVSAQNWTESESRYFPLELSDVKTVMGKLGSKLGSMLFSLCNGKDARKTLAIGMEWKSLTHSVVSFHGIFTLDHHAVLISTLCETHCKAYAVKDFDLEVNALYPLMGNLTKRRACDISDRENINSSVYIEATNTEPTYNLTMSTEFNLFIQINTAYSESHFSPLWQQMARLSELIELLQINDDLLDYTICIDYLSPYQLTDAIMGSLKDFRTVNSIPKSKLKWTNINVLDMRSEDFFEKLWTLLLKAQNLEVVLQCFDTIFEEIVNVKNVMQVPPHTTIGDIMKCVAAGTIELPTLNHTLALKFLIELGLNKLRNDYIFLLKNMDNRSLNDFNDRWEKLIQQKNVVTNVTTRTSQKNRRKTRVEMARDCAAGDCVYLFKYLDHLAHLHLTVEAMFLIMRCEIDAETAAIVHYDLGRRNVLATSFKHLQEKSVVDVECQLPSSTWKCLHSLRCKPVAVNVRMFSRPRVSSTATSIYHFVDSPIFPNYYNYGEMKTIGISHFDVKMKEGGKKYYVYKAWITTSTVKF